MFDWEFRDPWFLLVALAMPLVFWLAARTPAAVRYSSLAIVDRAPRSLRARLAKLPALLVALSIAVLAIGLAGPRTPDAETRVSREGIAVMMVIDRSSSMNARDLVPENLEIDRLTVVKGVFRRFVLGGKGAGEGRPDDTVGLIAFARYADSLCPLTLDHGNLATLVDDLEIVDERAEDGTAIGEGLALAVERLRRNRAKSKIAILLTDGVNNVGAIEPMRAAELAAAHDIKVYCIGAGTEGVAPVPVVTFFGRKTFRPRYVEIDEETLRGIADKTGGRYYRATDEETLARIYQEIDRLERTKVTEFRYMQYHEHYARFVLTGLCLIGFAGVLSGTVLRRVP
ncbi:MAG: VWA domain-containing protein [Pirellulales bacterium]